MKYKKTLLLSLFTAFMLFVSTGPAYAMVMWGKTELKQGQIGKVTILSDTWTYKIVNKDTIQQDKLLKKGGEFRVYTYKVIGDNELYGLGGGLFVQKSPVLKYETPSKAKLAQLRSTGENVALSATAKKTNQIVTVVANGSSARVSLFEKSGTKWNEVIATDGYVGKLGVGKAREGSKMTPKGSYSLGFAFGTSNPGTKLPFRKITPNSYWISNVNDPQYNTWQERTSSNRADEHLEDYPVQYQYAIVMNYDNGVGGGSAFFLHVSNGGPTAGCVSVPKSTMIKLMQRIQPGAYIINVNQSYEIENY